MLFGGALVAIDPFVQSTHKPRHSNSENITVSDTVLRENIKNTMAHG